MAGWWRYYLFDDNHWVSLMGKFPRSLPHWATNMQHFASANVYLHKWAALKVADNWCHGPLPLCKNGYWYRWWWNVFKNQKRVRFSLPVIMPSSPEIGPYILHPNAQGTLWHQGKTLGDLAQCILKSDTLPRDVRSWLQWRVTHPTGVCVLIQSNIDLVRQDKMHGVQAFAPQIEMLKERFSTLPSNANTWHVWQ